MIYSINRIQLTEQDATVMTGGAALPLSPRGHACLLLFLKANNQVLSKDQLMQVLWPKLVVSDDSLFKVIQEVRKALKGLGLDSEELRNVYGKGYQLKSKVTAHEGQPRRPMVCLLPVLLCLLVWLWMMNREVELLLTDTEYQQLIQSIESDFTQHQDGFAHLGIRADAHPDDQLRLAHIEGLSAYKQGDYAGSISHLRGGLEQSKSLGLDGVKAEMNLLLAKMFIYREDRLALKAFLDAAETHYGVTGDTVGLTLTQIERARYHQVMGEYPQSIDLLQTILQTAEANQDTETQMRSHSNLAYSYQQSGQTANYIKAHEATLDLALGLPNARYAAFSYGALSQVYLQQGQYQKAMKFAELALKYCLEQKDTNVFQQGFSYFYLMLPEAGHLELADNYLQQAIDIQAQFNPQGRLLMAELSLIKTKTWRQDHSGALKVLKELLAHDLDSSTKNEALAWFALNRHHRGDNIGAYSTAKAVLSDDATNEQAHFLALTALTLSAQQLERTEETLASFKTMTSKPKPPGLFEQGLWLNLVNAVHGWQHHTDQDINPDNTEVKWSQQQAEYQSRLQQIQIQTQPDEALIEVLDDYLKRILD
ncbi:winged helix-turn-helix domain-containing protein [Marinicella sp. S1101]|uniref:winged helix-turn-helix domain-containing protein n=1 Tax=Marinicella marina TaxID=2996016 RepID=UPI002260B229|nr:winged helix-turn-helix domain-containing protein [Marinicella marina]MCX7554862.1 winged helix-turn-helix domain-containing protein [Marinicella marina]MDJ1141520.1 winged helix-turn-helix domain-containing protein [Marinicella marina]